MAGSRGVTLVELVVFIVLVGIAMAGVFAAFNAMTAASADPQARKQALAIAESLMEEIALMPFTYCDPDDPAATTATTTADCAVAEALGAEGGESRYNAALPFDNVSDYHGFSMGPGITDMTGAALGGLDGYSVSVNVAQQGLAAIGASEALLVSVTVTGPSNTTVTLHGYRVRYAPNALP